MKRAYLILLMIFSCLFMYAQHGLFYMTFPEDAYFVPSGTTIGVIDNSDFFDAPKKGYLILDNDDTISNLTVQYDSYAESIIAYNITNNRSKPTKSVLSIERVKFLNAGSTILFNPHSAGFQPENSNEEISGLVELNYYSEEGDFIIGRYYYCEFERSNYNPIFETGRKDDRITLYSKKYLFYEGKYYELPKNKGKLKDMLKSILNLTLDKSVNIKKDEELIHFFKNVLK